jgi:Tol biopolymer transport system component
MIAARRLQRSFDARIMLVALLVLAACLAVVTPARAAIIVDRVSAGPYALADASASSVSVSQNGQWAVFESATQFVAGGCNSGTNIYLRDRFSKPNVTYCVTRGAYGSSHTPAISGDGNYIVFVSEQPTSGAPGGTYRVKRTDVVSGSATPATLTRVDVAPGTPPGLWINSGNTPLWYCPSISRTGQYIAFVSGDSTLPGANGSMLEVYWRDMNSSSSTAVVMASVDASGAPAALPCRTPSISGDGSKIAFATGASLVATDPGGVDIYVRDMTRGTTSWISAPGSTGTRNRSDSPVISDNGNVVAFTSLASDLVPGGTNVLRVLVVRDVFVRDLTTGVTTRVDLSATGAQTTTGDSFNPGLSPDGKYVSFQSASQDLAAGYYAVYLRSVTDTSTLKPIGPPTSGPDSAVVPVSPLNNGYTNVCVTAAGPRYIAFDSSASTLTSPAINGLVNAFVVDRFPQVLAVLSIPKLSVTTPRHNVYFYVSGTVSKDPGKATVQLKFYRYVKVGGAYKYVLYKTFTTYTASGQSSYKAKIKLPYVGSWYVRAYHPADTLHLLSQSSPRYFKTRT